MEDTWDEHSPNTADTSPAPLPPLRVVEQAGNLLRALSSPIRLSLLLQLEHHPCCVHQLVDALDIAQPAVSQHLRVLKNAGIVRAERRGREHVYSLVDEHVSGIVNDALDHAAEIIDNPRLYFSDTD